MDIIKMPLANDIEVQYVFHLKGKGDQQVIYLRFYLLLRSIRVDETIFSTGLSTTKEKWTGQSIRGTDIQTRLKNERLNSILTSVQDALHELKRVKLANVAAVMQEIEGPIKVRIR
jgi:hypothetical protein